MSKSLMIRVYITQTEGADSNVELEVNDKQTVGEIKKLLLDKDQSLNVEELVFDNEPVEDSKLISSFAVSDGELLLFTAKRRTLEVRTARRRPRCTFASCNSAPLRGVGDCNQCEGKFCSRHRLMEQHLCSGLKNCKQQLHERNAVKLQQQQTVAHKVL